MWYVFLIYIGKGCIVGLIFYKYNNDVVILFFFIGRNKYWFDCIFNIVFF